MTVTHKKCWTRGHEWLFQSVDKPHVSPKSKNTRCEVGRKRRMSDELRAEVVAQ